MGDFNVVIICNSRLCIRLEGDLEAWKRRLIVIEIDSQYSSTSSPKKYESGNNGFKVEKKITEIRFKI